MNELDPLANPVANLEQTPVEAAMPMEQEAILPEPVVSSETHHLTTRQRVAAGAGVLTLGVAIFAGGITAVNDAKEAAYYSNLQQNSRVVVE